MNDLLEAVPRALRILVLFVVTLALPSAVVAADKMGEAQAIREIERLGGRVERNEKLPGHPVTTLSLSGSQRFRDKDLSLLKVLTKMTALDLSGTEITDSGLKRVGELKIRIDGRSFTMVDLLW
jgi:hypothetical protein